MNNDRPTDLERAKQLGMTLDEFQSLVGHDPLETYSEFLNAGTCGPTDMPRDGDKAKKLKKKEYKDVEKTEATPYSLHDEMTDVTGIGDGTTVPFETDRDVRNKNPREMEHFWKRPVITPEDKALYCGYHVHSKDNMYGLHAHYPGGPLGGGHIHSPQNRLGYHTHRFSAEDLVQFKFARPGFMIELDGPHVHQHNAPDGKHVHCEENFGPASDEHSKMIKERDSRSDTN